MPKKQGIYATQPVAKAKRIAATNPLGSIAPTLGNMPSPMVPQHAGQLHGLGPQAKQFHHPSVRGVHSFGHTADLKQGHLRMSGATNAHRLGAHSKLKP